MLTNVKYFPLCFLLLCSVVFTAQADVVVVVNKDSKIQSISRADLGRIFLGKSTEVGGVKTTPINQIMASSSRKDFDSNMLGKTESQMKSYWSRQLFSGEGSPPEEVNGDIDVLKSLVSDASKIGYIDEAALNDAVRVVMIK